jgi:hypothetical protein
MVNYSKIGANMCSEGALFPFQKKRSTVTLTALYSSIYKCNVGKMLVFSAPSPTWLGLLTFPSGILSDVT